MFWRDTKGLSALCPGYKVALTVFLVVTGIGYLLGFANIYLTYSPADQTAGLSVADIRIAFWGAREATKLQKAVEGSMKQYLPAEADFQKTVRWLQDGAPEETWVQVVKPIFDASCSICHSVEARVADVLTVDYSHVQDYLTQDTGKPVPRLVSVSHTHVLANLPVLFVLALILSFTRFPQPLKAGVSIFAFASIVLDVGSWWLAKLSGSLAILVLLGGIGLAVSYLLLILLPLYDLWLRKPQAA